MYFLIKDDCVLEKCNAIWDKLSADIKKEFDIEPVCNKEYLKTKIKFCGDSRYTNADLKISLYVLIYIKIISWNCFIRNPKNYRVIHPGILYFSWNLAYFLSYFIVSVCL